MPNKEPNVGSAPKRTTPGKTVANVATPKLPAQKLPACIDGPPTSADGNVPVSPEQGTHSELEYKAVFASVAQGFELGENSRFKQRVFKFSEKPDAEILTTLKEIGFRYRPEERAWTIAANPETRQLTDTLARQWAGSNYIRRFDL